MINVEKKLKELIFNDDQKNIYKLIKKYSPKNIVKNDTAKELSSNELDKFMSVLEKSMYKMFYFRYTFSYSVPPISLYVFPIINIRSPNFLGTIDNKSL